MELDHKTSITLLIITIFVILIGRMFTYKPYTVNTKQSNNERIYTFCKDMIGTETGYEVYNGNIEECLTLNYYKEI